MAERPAWKYNLETKKLERNSYEFVFNPGFSVTQKQKNIKALHEQIGEKTLEVSTKSPNETGISFSAFNLRLEQVPLENIFQSSKRYEFGGPYIDMLQMHPRDAKRDERHHRSGKLTAFVYHGMEFPLEPKTFFYDYIYIIAVKESIAPEKIKEIFEYTCFTDIEFNPKKSINCQAKSAALLKAFLTEYGEIPDIRNDMEEFVRFYRYVGADRV